MTKYELAMLNEASKNNPFLIGLRELDPKWIPKFRGNYSTSKNIHGNMLNVLVAVQRDKSTASFYHQKKSADRQTFICEASGTTYEEALANLLPMIKAWYYERDQQNA